MSLHRRAAKRDTNEPAIVSALETLGCVVWRVSGKGLPDLVVFHRNGRNPDGSIRRRTFVADVKGPKEKATPAQEEMWGALSEMGFSVFILRTPEDAAKMLNNALQPWEPAPWCQNPGCIHRGPCPEAKRPRNGDAEKAGGMSVPRNGRDAKKACGCLRSLGRCEHSGSYTPPRSAPVDAAKEAEATFAPAERVELADPCACRLGVLCSYHKKRP